MTAGASETGVQSEIGIVERRAKAEATKITNQQYLMLQEMVDKEKIKNAPVNHLSGAHKRLDDIIKGTASKGGGTTITIQMAFQQAEADAKQALQGHSQVQVSINTEDMG